MGIADSLKGLFRRADTGAAGPPAPEPTTKEGSVSVPANPEGTPNLEGSGPNSTVAPDLGETETPSPVEVETTIPVATEGASGEEKVEVKTPMPSETEEPTSRVEGVESVIPPSSPTASVAESQP